MEKQGTGSNAPSPKCSPRSRNASHKWTGWNHERGRIEPRMDTNGHKWTGRNHEKHEKYKGGK